MIEYLLLAESPPPELDTAYWVALISRFAHIASAIVLLGGIAYLRLVVAPGVARRKDDEPAQLFGERRTAWAMWVGITTLLLVATGFYNYIFVVIRPHEKLSGGYHALFGVKFLLALVVFFLAAIVAGKTAAADRFRAHAKTWLALCLVVGLIVVLLANVMKSFPRVPKTESNASVVTGSE